MDVTLLNDTGRRIVCGLILIGMLCTVGCHRAGGKGPSEEISIPETEQRTDTVSDTHPRTESETAEETAPPTESETETETETETEAPDPYLILTRFRGQLLSDAEALLREASLAYTVTEEYNDTIPAGSVCAVYFRGDVLETTYRIHRDYPVDVRVSLGKDPTVQTQPPTERPRRRVAAVDDMTIYLTFDDGPSSYTEGILATLAKYGVKATFFTVGQNMRWFPSRVRAIAEDGHLLACHSYSHDYPSLYTSAGATMAEVVAWEAAAEAAVGALPEHKVMRFPGGSNTTYMTRERMEEIYAALHEAGYTCFDWTFANNDRLLYQKPEDMDTVEWLKESAQKTLASAERAPGMPKIMLLHDSSGETAEMLDWLIGYLLDKGYKFGTLDELEGDWLF